eukprot:m.20646 g.20646  ORF g.20646 m.20646 type:complete len:350 (+) comp11037_c0_seq1:298-1347(+)
MAVPQLTWTRLTPKPDPQYGCPIPRSSHGLSIVQNGTRLLVLGGENVARTPISVDNSYWAADLIEGEWRWRLLSSKDAPPERIAQAQATCDDKYVYIFGGRAGITMDEQAMSDLWMLDCSGKPGDETWIEVKPVGGRAPEARSFHRMICIDQSLYVFGGCSAGHGRLADLHRFDLETKVWYDLGAAKLRGRGGANLVPLASQTKIGAIAGFAGEEANDGQVFDVADKAWHESMLVEQLKDMRPRSVCVAASFPSLGTVIFGGEVDPSDRGHEGAGGFENDLVVLDESTGSYKTTVKAGDGWPQTRGWSDGAAYTAQDGVGQLFIFGGLSGNDAQPERLDDLWLLTVKRA